MTSCAASTRRCATGGGSAVSDGATHPPKAYRPRGEGWGGTSHRLERVNQPLEPGGIEDIRLRPLRPLAMGPEAYLLALWGGAAFACVNEA